MFVYTIQPVVKPVVKPSTKFLLSVSSCVGTHETPSHRQKDHRYWSQLIPLHQSQTQLRLLDRFETRLIVVYVHLRQHLYTTVFGIVVIHICFPGTESVRSVLGFGPLPTGLPCEKNLVILGCLAMSCGNLNRGR